MPTKMVYADLEESDLTGATFPNTDLTGAVLRGANLTGANLRGWFLAYPVNTLTHNM